MWRTSPILLLLACGGPSVEITGARAELADVGTVVVVTWQTSEPALSRVAFGVGGATDRSTPAEAEPSTDHRAVLVGLPPDSDVTWRIQSGDAATDPATITTGALPDGVPATTATGSGNDRFLLLPSTGDVQAGDANWILLLDPDGAVTWAHEDTRGLSVFRARVAGDGSGIVYGSVIDGGGPAAGSEIVRVAWTGEELSALPVPDLAHDFVELADGTVVSLAYETRDDVLGNDLLAIHADGSFEQVWSAWDCYDPVTHPSDDPQHGWTHANALDLDPATGEYLVGIRNLATITRVDPVTRTCPWALGGVGTLDVDGARFIHQHQFDVDGDTVLVFDNDGAAGNVSRAIEYAVDGETATEVRTFEADPPLYSFILGDTERLPDGDTLVLYAVPQTIDRVDGGGERVWRLEVEGGGPLGFVEVLESPYPE